MMMFSSTSSSFFFFDYDNAFFLAMEWKQRKTMTSLRLAEKRARELLDNSWTRQVIYKFTELSNKVGDWGVCCGVN